MTIAFFGTYDTKTTPRIQAMIDGIREHEITVVECNAPLAVNTAERVAIMRNPWRLPIFALKIANCWLRLIYKRVKLPPCDAVVIGYMGQFDIHLAKLLFPKKTLILDYMVSGAEAGQDRQLTNSRKTKLLMWLDNQSLRTANIVIVDTEEHRQMLPEKYKEKGLIVLVGAPKAWFDAAKKPTKITKKPTKVVFFGLYTPLQGTTIIAHALAALPSDSTIEVTMIGSGQDEPAVKKIVKNISIPITWIDWVDANKLPNLVASHDICLGVFGTGPKSLAVVPNKIYQGAAAGCALITSDTPPQRRLLKQSAILTPPGNAEALAKELYSLLNNPSKLFSLQTSAYELARRSFTTYQIVQPLLDLLSKDAKSLRKNRR